MTVKEQYSLSIEVSQQITEEVENFSYTKFLSQTKATWNKT